MKSEYRDRETVGIDREARWSCGSRTSAPERTRLRRCARRAAHLAAAVVALLAVLAAPAVAAEAWWQLSSTSRPAILQPGTEALIVVQATNVGDASVNAAISPVTLSDKLPAGLVATSVVGSAGSSTEFPGSPRGEVHCLGVPAVSCTWAGPEHLQPYEVIEMFVTVRVEPGSVAAATTAAVSGGDSYSCAKATAGTGRYTSSGCRVSQESEAHVGNDEGAEGAQVGADTNARPIRIGPESTPFEIERFGLTAESEGGTPATQAGSHPFQLTTDLALNQPAERSVGEEGTRPTQPPGLAKDVRIDLPPGLVGNARALPACTEAQFAKTLSGNVNLCPDDSAVGVASLDVEARLEFNLKKPTNYVVPVFNIVPAPGEPARFGFEVEKVAVLIDTAVKTGNDYGVVAKISNISQLAAFVSSTVSLWGVPGDPRHDTARGWDCVAGGFWAEEAGLPSCREQNDAAPVPFLSLPSACGGPLDATAQIDSWEDPIPRAPDHTEMAGLTGCNRLAFAPSLSAQPEVRSSSTPTGLLADVHMSQEGSDDPTGLADADVRTTTVTLPEGVSLNPSGADGLEACTEAQIGFEGPAPETGVALFGEGLASPFCPSASKIASVQIRTPLLQNPLKGAIYLATQFSNPFNSLVAMYLVAEDPVSGVRVNLPGSVALNGVTGRVEASFTNTPQLPFEDLEVNFFGGERAPLATPQRCGSYVTTASFVPWSGNSPVAAASSFTIDQGPNGKPCPTVLPFSPTVSAGADNNLAAAFSPFRVSVSREDGDQRIQVVSLRMPPGFAGQLAAVKLCPEAQANAGTCGPESLIGHAVVSVGVGDAPFTVAGGAVYITQSYAGAPYGLSITSPAKAGPFDLGSGVCDCVIVRARINVDPHTAQVTIATDPSGPYSIPHILDGIPLEIRHISVAIDRQAFAFNPSSCQPLSIDGTISSAEEGTSPAAVPFQVSDCANLRFAPKLSVSTVSHTSKADGASLTAKIAYPSGSEGSEANIAKVKVDLPKDLPDRLSTLHKACVAAVFEANPANCSREAVVGHATVRTPVLPVPLTGPAYFVSHGGQAFPSLTMVLQGYGITIDLVGATDIKKGVTSTTFRAVPDVPFSTFELTLPQGKNSALAAYGNLCATKLMMPTAFVAQNGAELHQSIHVAVDGCGSSRKNKQRRKSTATKKG